MAVPKRALLLTSAAFAFFTARYELDVAPFHSQSYIKNTVATFFLLYFVRLVWNIIVYPLFLTPLRKLPTPEVSLLFNAVEAFACLCFTPISPRHLPPFSLYPSLM